MNTKYNCPHCNAAVESDSSQAGLAGECPECRELLVVPAARPAHPIRAQITTSLPANVQRPHKTGEDYAADAICGAAKVTLKAAKYAAPIAGRIGVKVAGRAAKATARAAVPHAKNAMSFIDRLFYQSPEEIAEEKRREQITTYWTIGILIVICGITALFFSLPQSMITQILSGAVGIVAILIFLVIFIGVVALFTSKSGRLILYWFFGR
jgi:hypothetical protein